MMRDFEDKAPARISAGEWILCAIALIFMVQGYIGAGRMLWSAISSLFS